MKQLYSLIGFLALSSLTYAQQNIPVRYSAEQAAVNAPENPASVTTTASSANRAVFLSEDFESGTFPPAGWNVTSGAASTITVPAEETWHENTTGNPGNSATVLRNNVTSVHDEWLISPQVTLPTGNGIRLSFDYLASNYWLINPNDNADLVCMVSTVGGTIADLQAGDTLFHEQNEDFQTFVWTGYQTAMTAYAGQDVYIGFHIIGQELAQTGIDNIVIQDIEDNDIRITEAFDADIANDFQHRIFNYEQNREMQFTVLVNNNGGAMQENIVVNYDILDESGASVASGTSSTSIATLAPDATDTLTFGTGFTAPNMEQAYDIELEVESDEVDAIPGNNTATRLIAVDEFMWARETGLVDGNFQNIAGANGAGVQIGPTFFASADMMTRGMTIGISGTSPTGQIIFGALYILDATGTYTPLNVTVEHTITTADLNTLLTLEWEDGSNIPITAGDQLLACAAHFGGPDADQPRFATAGNTIQGTVLGFDGSGSIFQLIDPPVPVVRLNSDPTISIDENPEANFTLGQNVPNPANANSIINYSLKEAAAVSFEIVDLTGRVVLNSNEGTQSVGDHTIEVDASQLAAGVYTYSLTVDGTRVSRQMVVSK